MNQSDYDNIRQTIDSAAQGVERIIEAAGSFGKSFSESMQDFGKEFGEEMRKEQKRSTEEVKKTAEQAASAYNKWAKRPAQLYKQPEGGIGGIIESIIGFAITIAGGNVAITNLVKFIMKILSGSLGIGSLISTAVGAVILAVGLSMGLGGLSKYSRMKRYSEYLTVLGNKTYASISSLAAAVGKSESYVLKDLQKMINERWFFQAHIDDEKKTLIISDATYADYKAMAAAQKPDEEAEEELIRAGFTTEGREILRQGEEYLQKIRRANAELPGEVITAKLQKLEDVIYRILAEVREQPSSAGELRKLMNYYLPTTWKLLESYQQIEKESYKTELMISTQRDIEQTIDTINAAFEKLLNNLFQKQAWDISSDISVLNSMLTREGLKNGEFSLNNKEE